jgi:nucleotide-binding universal stress UspA family protein
MSLATRIVVGFDGSPGAECAVRWAATEAERRGVTLRIVTVDPYVDLSLGHAAVGVVSAVNHTELAVRVAAIGRLHAERILPASQIDAVSVWGQPAAVLVRESTGAAVVAVGHPERGQAREYVTGSVAFAVTAHAACDVAVVPQGDLIMPGPTAPVVVGTDGSSQSMLAARRAAEVAGRSHAPLRIVQAWQFPSLPETRVVTAADRPEERALYEKAAHESVEATKACVCQAFPDLAVQATLVGGHPVVALLHAAKDAGLLVVGTRGLGGFKRLVLGSVSRAVVHYAETPVLVVRP